MLHCAGSPRVILRPLLVGLFIMCALAGARARLASADRHALPESLSAQEPSWRLYPSPVTRDLNALDVSWERGGLAAWAVGDEGTILRRLPGGEDWVVVDSPTNATLREARLQRILVCSRASNAAGTCRCKPKLSQRSRPHEVIQGICHGGGQTVRSEPLQSRTCYIRGRYGLRSTRCRGIH